MIIYQAQVLDFETNEVIEVSQFCMHPAKAEKFKEKFLQFQDHDTVVVVASFYVLEDTE